MQFKKPQQDHAQVRRAAPPAGRWFAAAPPQEEVASVGLWVSRSVGWLLDSRAASSGVGAPCLAPPFPSRVGWPWLWMPCEGLPGKRCSLPASPTLLWGRRKSPLWNATLTLGLSRSPASAAGETTSPARPAPFPAAAGVLLWYVGQEGKRRSPSFLWAARPIAAAASESFLRLGLGRGREV